MQYINLYYVKPFSTEDLKLLVSWYLLLYN